MPNLRVSQLWNERPWRRKKQETAEDQRHEKYTRGTTFKSRPDELSHHTDQSLTATIERNAKRLSRIWKNNDDDRTNNPVTGGRISRQIRSRRSFFRSNDEPILEGDEQVEDMPTLSVERESLVKRLRRQSQNFTLPRPRTSSGIPRRRSFFGSTVEPNEHEVHDELPSLLELRNGTRPRHIPIIIDQMQPGQKNRTTPSGLKVFGPGVAITTNAVEDAGRSPTNQSKTRPMSSSSNFSQIRTRATTVKPLVQRHQSPPIGSDTESSDEDVLTALPSMDFKEFHIGELKPADIYTAPPVDRHVLKRVTPKIVDIIAPRPLSMFSPSQTARKSPEKTHQGRPKSAAPLKSTLIGPMEDGPKGDWSRTRYSWVGTGGEGESEQLEWEKLKQFMEAYGNGQDGGIITVRPVDTDSSDSSGSTRNSHLGPGHKFSNAQALAALEFGLS